MPRTVLENLLVMEPQATAIGILILVAVLGLFLGACAYLLVTGWRIGKRHNVEVTGAARLYRAASVWTAGLYVIGFRTMPYQC